MPEFHILHSRILFDHPMASIIVDRLKFQDREQAYFYIRSPVEAVATVGITDANEIVLTYQYRHPVGRYIYDLPAGRLEPGEDPLSGACREFEEETGPIQNISNPSATTINFLGLCRLGLICSLPVIYNHVNKI